MASISPGQVTNTLRTRFDCGGTDGTPVFVVSLIGGWAILHAIVRRSDHRPPIIATVTSATVVLAIIVG